jgi:hypothetical protein
MCQLSCCSAIEKLSLIQYEFTLLGVRIICELSLYEFQSDDLIQSNQKGIKTEDLTHELELFHVIRTHIPQRYSETRRPDIKRHDLIRTALSKGNTDNVVSKN